MKVYSSTSSAGNLEITLHFLGANSGIVTGSATVVSIKRNDSVRNILIDYGWFQGSSEVMNLDRAIVGDSIDCVLLTHAHLDHCGSLPMLFKVIDGQVPFAGKVYGSRETLNQIIPILRDSAKQHEYSYKKLQSNFEKTNQSLHKEKEKAEREEANPHDIASLDSAISSIVDQYDAIPFSMEDVDETIRHFSPVDVDYQGTEISLFEGIDAKFIATSHINGSTMVEVSATLGKDRYTVVFTGDIGRRDSLLYRNMNYPHNPDAKAIVMESLHGTEREVETLNESIISLRRIIKKALKRQKSVIIPTFAMDRSAMLIKILNKFMDQGMYLQCVIDSPLIMEELMLYTSSYLENSVWFSKINEYPFNLERFRVVNDYAEHKYVANSKEPFVVITSSGMGYGGRVLDYFEHHIQDEDSVFVFPGYLVDECPARQLVETEAGKIVEINGNRYVKHCETYQLHGFSAHGYFDEKLRVLRSYPNIQTIFLNHGDDESIGSTFEGLEDCISCGKIKPMDIIVPEFDEFYKVK